MKQLALLLVVCLIVGNASAGVYLGWTDGVTGNYNDPASWNDIDTNGDTIPDDVVPVLVSRDWTTGSYDGDSVTIDNATVTVPVGTSAYAAAFRGPAYSGGTSGTMDIYGTLDIGYARAGSAGDSVVYNVHPGGKIEAVWGWNQPRNSASLPTTAHMNLWGDVIAGEFNLNTGVNTTGTVTLHAGGTITERGSNSAQVANQAKLQGFIDTGLISSPDGVPFITVLSGQGYAGNDAYQVSVPEPATMSLLALGAVTMLRRRR